MKRLAFVFLAALSLPSFAAEAAQRTMVVRAARMFDGTGEGIITPGLVVVTGDRITAVGPGAAVPSDAEVIDLGDMTLLPGFIDSHTHLTGQMPEDFYRGYFESMMRHPTEQAHIAASYARKTLEAGFTTVRDLGASDYVDVGLRNAINTGFAIGPRMLVAIHAIGPTGGHGDSDPVPPGRIVDSGAQDGVCNGPAECRAAARFQAKYGADVIKIMASGGVLSLSDPVDNPALTLEEMRAIVDEAHHLGRKVAAHCHGDAAAKVAVEAGVDSIEHGTFLRPDTLRMMKERGTYLVPTLMPSATLDPSRFPPAIEVKAAAAIKSSSEMFRNALSSGVRIAFGTDAGVYTHGRNAEEFAAMTRLGMRPAAALRSATSVAAELLGVDAGSLKTGKLADIIAVRGNPLENIHVTSSVTFVMKGGVVVKK